MRSASKSPIQAFNGGDVAIRRALPLIFEDTYVYEVGALGRQDDGRCRFGRLTGYLPFCQPSLRRYW